MGFMQLDYPEKYFVLEIDYELINPNKKAVAIYSVDYYWSYPIFPDERTSEMDKNSISELYQFHSEKFGINF